MLIHGDSLNELKALPDCSVDSVVTDPPYGLGNTSTANVAECLKAWAAGETWQPKGAGFMGKSWDAWVPPPELWREVHRVLKHGGHILAFAGSRTQDLMSISLRLAGFEIRDTIMWLYSSGFPKSHNISLGIDKASGCENRGRAIPTASSYQACDIEQAKKLTSNPVPSYEPQTEDAKQWAGWGTALKPAYEPIILARKAPQGSIANNTLLHGVGGLNIDENRIAYAQSEKVEFDKVQKQQQISESEWSYGNYNIGHNIPLDEKEGRWPANIMLDEIALKAMGSTGRFYFCAKASKVEREAGLKMFELKKAGAMSGKETRPNKPTNHPLRANIHPTVKPIALMRYLCRLITPPDGTILEPFAGSGTTLIAAHLEQFNFIGIERELEYVEIIRARLKHWQGADNEDTSKAEKTSDNKQLRLFK